jgi:hypothetical protein
VKIVKFVKRYDIYNVGEVAGFPVEEADKLIAKGVITAVVTPPEETPESAKPQEQTATTGKRNNR